MYNFAEIEFASSDPSASRRLWRGVEEGRLRPLAPRVYSGNLDEEPHHIIRRNALKIADHLYPETIISFRSKFDLAKSGTLFLTGSYERTVKYPGLLIRQIKGPGPFRGDARFLSNLYLASDARAFLECLSRSRTPPKGVRRGWDTDEAEEEIERYITRAGEDAFNKVRDEAKALAREFEWDSALKKFQAIAAGVLGTGKHKTKTAAGRARASRTPYDSQRLSLFEGLAKVLTETDWPNKPSILNASPEAIRNHAFFESYFSNFIEGTEFDVDEAHKIVFEDLRPDNRPADAHDILGTYAAITDKDLAQQVPFGFEEWIFTMKKRHVLIMDRRPEIKPGTFKNTPNRGGATVFVHPDLVKGTLKEGVRIGSGLSHPMAKGIYAHFLISEVHPFNDGNGRVSRLFLNAPLSLHGWPRIIVPVSMKYDYTQAMKALSNNGRAEAQVKVFNKLERFSSGVDFSDFRKAWAQLENLGAFEEESRHLTVEDLFPAARQAEEGESVKP